MRRKWRDSKCPLQLKSIFVDRASYRTPHRVVWVAFAYCKAHIHTKIIRIMDVPVTTIFLWSRCAAENVLLGGRSREIVRGGRRMWGSWAETMFACLGGWFELHWGNAGRYLRFLTRWNQRRRSACVCKRARRCRFMNTRRWISRYLMEIVQRSIRAERRSFLWRAEFHRIGGRFR